MARGSKKGKGIIVVINILLFLILIGSIGGNYFLITKAKDKKKEYKNMQIEYNDAKKVHDEKAKEVTNAAEELKKYENIDELVVSSKKDYFKAIKEVEDAIIAGKTKSKIAYLTFDDGPYNSTWKVFDILDQKNVKATFFTISLNGENCFDKKSENCHRLYPEYVKRGHTIANHTYYHAIWGSTYSSPNAFIEQIKMQEEQIKNKTGISPNIIRFPGGIPTAKSRLGANGFETVTAELRKMGYGWVDWTAEDGDGKESLKSGEQAMSILKSMIDEPIEVILMHDYNWDTISILPSAIDYLQGKGYTLFPLFYESNMVNK
jgi:peptidoglycan/xylan/chitin deacetylase (PgdA/CDA1 family)